MIRTAVAVIVLMSLVGCGGSSSEDETPLQSSQNQIPIAHAGNDQNVATTTDVMLNGSASADSDGDAISYKWSLMTVPPQQTSC